MRVVAESPSLVGEPIAVWAFVISLFSFSVAAAALAWQIIKHFLDGGRVKVYLNAAVYEPELMVATNQTGKFGLPNKMPYLGVARGRALELAQLVVENPGKIPVTIYSPGFYFAGHGKKNHTVSPRMFSTDAGYGSDYAISDLVVRLEPYARVTFLLDFWSVVPGLLSSAPRGRVFVRGHVGVAGRSKKPQRSSWRLRWRIERGTYTAIDGSPQFSPFAVMWQELYRFLPERGDSNDRHRDAGTLITRGMARYLLDEAMSRFDQRPTGDEMKDALEKIAKRDGDRFPSFSLYVYEAFEALDRMEGHLTAWTDDLLYRTTRDDETG